MSAWKDCPPASGAIAGRTCAGIRVHFRAPLPTRPAVVECGLPAGPRAPSNSGEDQTPLVLDGQSGSSRALTLSSCESRTLSTKMEMPGAIRRISTQVSKPSIPGMLRSRSTTSNLVRCSRSNASFPCITSSVLKPNAPKVVFKTCRIEVSSSTTKIWPAESVKQQTLLCRA
jgi:hypothetical protein